MRNLATFPVACVLILWVGCGPGPDCGADLRYNEETGLCDCLMGGTFGADGYCHYADGAIPVFDGAVPISDASSHDGGADLDAGLPEAGTGDSAADDAGDGEPAEPDASEPDAGPPDSGSPDSGPPDSGPPTCAPTHTCVPPIPTGWNGPVAVGEGATTAPACPSAYPTEQLVAQRGPTAPPASCGCGCFVSGTSCQIQLSSGGTFMPIRSCDSPPVEDQCLEAAATTSCTTTGSPSIPPVAWTARARVCGSAVAASACAGGNCLPRADLFGDVCIVRSGDHPCPAGFPDRTVYHGSVTDTRACSACSCTTFGAACELELQICSVGFRNVSLSSTLGNQECLLSSDGDGVSLLSSSVTSAGSCSTSGGAAQGTVLPAAPTTACCLR